ncbi:MAG: hypothetical protein EON59_17335 [Alphaproteobacteria bacterium]|nr:MAG: hypothetical protein EON59_17335 [Alphaproteobacteria bacterium]
MEHERVAAAEHMTAKRRLVPMTEVREVLDTLITYGIDVQRCVIDITSEGVRVSPPAESRPGNAYEA